MKRASDGTITEPSAKKLRAALQPTPHSTLLEVEDFRHDRADYQVNKSWKYEEKRSAEQETDVLVPVALFDDISLKPTATGQISPHSDFLWRWAGASQSM
jgi:hypothetical protein